MDISALLYGVTIWALPVLFAITFHEAAHGYMAERLGDDTARIQARISANPLRHIDRFGTIVLPALLLLAGSPVMFGYAKPVPVNFARLRNPRRDMVWVALAGPLTNIGIATISALLFHVVALFPPIANEWLAHNLNNSVLINLVLAVFNMFPLPPLDGGRVAVGLLPHRPAMALARLEQYGLFILIGLLFLLPWFGRMIGIELNLFAWFVLPPVGALFDAIIWLTGLG